MGLLAIAAGAPANALRGTAVPGVQAASGLTVVERVLVDGIRAAGGGAYAPWLRIGAPDYGGKVHVQIGARFGDLSIFARRSTGGSGAVGTNIATTVPLGSLPPDGTWVKLVTEVGPSLLRVRLLSDDGATEFARWEDASASGPIDTNSGDVFLSNPDGGALASTRDWVALYNVTGAAVAALPPASSTIGLLHLWRFLEQTGTSATSEQGGVLALGTGASWAGTAGSNDNLGPPTVSIAPTSATVVGGGTCDVAVTTNYGAPTVTADQGTVAFVGGSTYRYTAPPSNAGTTATLTATNGSASASAVLTITPGPPAITAMRVKPAGPFTLADDTTLQLAAILTPFAGASTAVTWTSDTPSVATVDADGFVNAIAPGSAQIRATSVFDPTKVIIVGITVPAANGAVDYSAAAAAIVSQLWAPGGNLDLLRQAVEAQRVGLNALIAASLTPDELNATPLGANAAQAAQLAGAASSNALAAKASADAATSASTANGTAIGQLPATVKTTLEAPGAKLATLHQDLTQPVGELTALPSATSVTLLNAVRFLFHRFRNARATSNGARTVYRADGVTPLHAAALSDDGTTFREAAEA